MVRKSRKRPKAQPPRKAALDRRARELEKQAKKLQEEVARSGLGADMQPVPEPTVRDLSVPQAKPGRAAAKPPPPETAQGIGRAAAAEGETAAPREVARRHHRGHSRQKIGSRKNPPKPKPKRNRKKLSRKSPREPVVHIADGSVPAKPRPKKRRSRITVASTPIIGNYQLPPLDFLQHPDMTVKPTESKEELMANARLMQQTLAQFEIEVSLGDITKGPTITRYELHPAPGVKLEKITALSNNIAAALKAERIHILAPVPGKSSVGVEVPNPGQDQGHHARLVRVRRMAQHQGEDSHRAGQGRLWPSDRRRPRRKCRTCSSPAAPAPANPFASTAIITSLLYRFSPDQLRFVMIDPKVVELQQYNALPHLVVPVVTDPKKVILALRWVVNEMEKRYQIFARVGVRNIASFNSRPKNKPLPQQEPELPLTAKKEKVEPGAEGFAVEVDEEIVVPREEDIVIPEKLSYIVVIIDELADLMLVAPADVEMAIARITQMARAAGIHCIVATQRPSVDVITGVIKANITARIAFQCASRVDSRTILDAMGADKLLGKGDMLYLPPGSAKLIRAQGALITDQEIKSIVEFIAKQGKPNYDMEIHQQLSQPAGQFRERNRH